jgi:two-component system LytT family response regulator
MMQAIIVDDEQSNVENLQALLKRHCSQVNVIAYAYNIETATRLISQHQPDILFLDIQLGLETGFDVLRLLPSKSFEVIFITAFDHYGIQAIKFAALDYILKPIDIDELVRAVTTAEVKIKSKQSYKQLDFLLSQLNPDRSRPVKIALPQRKETRYIMADNIRRCQADNTYTFFFLTNEDKILVSKPLKEYADLLQNHGFIRTHQSHLVNTRFVKSWLKEDGGTLLLDNGDRIPISKIHRDKVRTILARETF